MYDNKLHVETNANLILNTIRENPNVTINKLQTILENHEKFPNLTSSMVRKYIYALHKEGYVQKAGVHALTYKALTDMPFTYVPVAWNHKKQRNAR